jgi:hypothetical protein
MANWPGGRLIYNGMRPHRPRHWVWQRGSDGAICITAFRPPRFEERILVVTDDLDLAARVADRGRRVLPDGPRGHHAREPELGTWRSTPLPESERRAHVTERSESVRAVSGGLPTLGKRR